MKKTILLACFCLFLAASSFVSVQAYAADSACADDMKQIIDNRAETLRVRDKALYTMATPPNDPTLGLTCFDQSIGVSARLGKIFSDKVPEDVPAPNTSVFTPTLAYPNYGADDFLIQDLQDVIVQPLQSHLSNFGGTLSQVLGTDTVSSVVTGFIDSLLAPINSITSALSGFSGTISSIMNVINTIENIAQTLSLPMPSATIIAIVAALDAAQSTLQSLISAFTSALNAAIGPLVNGILDQIMGPATDMTCDNIKNTFSDDDPASGAISIQGNGSHLGVGYADLSMSGFMTLADTVAANPPADDASYYPSTFPEILSQGGDGAIMQQALDYMNGPLSGPTGGLSSWKVPPTLPPDASVDDIIGAM